MIYSASEFIALRESEEPEEYRRSTHEELSDEVWDEVVEIRPDMIKWLIHNKTIPVAVLRKFSHYKDAEVRFWVATKRKLDREIFQRLSEDTNTRVRQTVAYNAKCPSELLEVLADDPCELVSNPAKERLHQRAEKLDSSE